MVWNRVIAIIIDWVILGVASVPFMDFGTETRIQNGREVETLNFGLNGPEFWIASAAFFAYFVLMEWLFGATIGKFILGIRVARQDGQVASFPSVLVRNLMRIVDSFPYIIPYLVGFIAMGKNDGRQRLGDMLAGTAVVRKEEFAQALPDGPSPGE